MPARLQILMFGGLGFRAGDDIQRHFRTQKCAALLGYAALHLGKPLYREVLMELLWPECPPAAARRNLSTALWSLRQQLAAAAGTEVLESDRSTVTLCPAVVETDARAFERGVRTAHATSDPAERIAHLTAAVELYQGEFLAGLYDDWVFPERTRLAGLFEKALEEICDALEAADDLSEALRYASAWLSVDRLSSKACGKLMHLYARGAQPSAALAVYRDFARLQEQELGAEPQEWLQQIADRIARGEYAPRGTERIVEPRPTPPEPEGYVRRPADFDLERALANRESIVLLKGPRQSGKTSLLARGRRKGKDAGFRIVSTDLSALGKSGLQTPDAFHRALADSLAEQLEPPKLPRDVWEPDWAPSLNLRRYLRRWVLRDVEQPLLWTIDEVDRLFGTPFYGDVFGLFRSWHNERSSDPEGVWSRLTLALAYSTEAHLFIPDLDQSPFNVGVRLELGDFSSDQIAELNRFHERPLKNESELSRVRARVGGHPYLVERALSSLRKGTASLTAIEETFAPFSDHLRGIREALRRDPALTAVVQDLLCGEGSLSEESFFRLRSAGLIRGEAPDAVQFRCGLYRDYLQQQFGQA